MVLSFLRDVISFRILLYFVSSCAISLFHLIIDLVFLLLFECSSLHPGYLLVKIDSEEYLAFQTAVIVAFGMSGPVFAHFNLPVNLPDHYFPFVGFCALMVVHVYTLATATEGKTKKS